MVSFIVWGFLLMSAFLLSAFHYYHGRVAQSPASRNLTPDEP